MAFEKNIQFLKENSPNRDYSSYSLQPSLEKLIDVARFSNVPSMREQASNELVENYILMGAYRDLNNMSHDKWLDKGAKTAAQENITGAMLNYYLRRVKSKSENKIGVVVDYENSHYYSSGNDEILASFEFVAKDSQVDSSYRTDFSKTILDSWVEEGFYLPMKKVSKNKFFSIPEVDFHEVISTYANTKLDETAQNRFSKMSSALYECRTSILDFDFNDFYFALFDADLDSEIRAKGLSSVIDAFIFEPSNFGFFNKLITKASTQSARADSSSPVHEIRKRLEEVLPNVVRASMYRAQDDFLLACELLDSPFVSPDFKKNVKKSLDVSFNHSLENAKKDIKDLDYFVVNALFSHYLTKSQKKKLTKLQ